MSDNFGFTLHSPLNKEDWDKLLDVELEKSPSVTFQTPQGRQVRYIQCDVLDKIRAEILDEAEYAYADFNLYKEDILNAEPDELPDDDFRFGMKRAVEIIDKYRKGGAE